MANYQDLLTHIKHQGKSDLQKCRDAVRWLGTSGNNITYNELTTFLQRITSYNKRFIPSPRGDLSFPDSCVFKHQLTLRWLEKNNLAFTDFVALFEQETSLGNLDQYHRNHLVKEWLKKPQVLSKEGHFKLINDGRLLGYKFTKDEEHNLVRQFFSREDCSGVEFIDILKRTKFFSYGSFTSEAAKRSFVSKWLENPDHILNLEELRTLLNDSDLLAGVNLTGKLQLCKALAGKSYKVLNINDISAALKFLKLTNGDLREEEPQIKFKVARVFSQYFLKDEFIANLNNESGVFFSLTPYQKAETILSWLETAGNNLTLEEYSAIFKNDHEAVFFSVTNLRRKNVREYISQLNEASQEKYTNATIVAIKSGNERRNNELPKIDTFADSLWQDFPIMVFNENVYFDKYFPQDVYSDRFDWRDGEDFREARERFTDYAKRLSHVKGNSSSTKPTKTSALRKNQELYERIGKKNYNKRYLLNSGAYTEVGAESAIGNVETQNLTYNECHIKPSILDCNAIAVTSESVDYKIGNTFHVDSKRYIGILSAIYLRESIARSKKNADIYKMLEFEKNKFKRLVSEIKYFKVKLKDISKRCL